MQHSLGCSEQRRADTPFVEAIMNAEQRTRLKPSARLAREWNIPRGAEGTLICRYRVLARNLAASDRLDVRFSPQLVLWGAPAAEFEVVGGSGPEAHGPAS
jgi:hypothetical protein